MVLYITKENLINDAQAKIDCLSSARAILTTMNKRNEQGDYYMGVTDLGEAIAQLEYQIKELQKNDK